MIAETSLTFDDIARMRETDEFLRRAGIPRMVTISLNDLLDLLTDRVQLQALIKNGASEIAAVQVKELSKPQ